MDLKNVQYFCEKLGVLEKNLSNLINDNFDYSEWKPPITYLKRISKNQKNLNNVRVGISVTLGNLIEEILVF